MPEGDMNYKNILYLDKKTMVEAFFQIINKCFFYAFRKKSIHWTIELRFHSTKVVLHDHG